jgi:hypothetical protein
MDGYRLYVKTSKGWNTIGLYWTVDDAERAVDKIINGKIRLRYDHEKVFKILVDI